MDREPKEDSDSDQSQGEENENTLGYGTDSVTKGLTSKPGQKLK